MQISRLQLFRQIHRSSVSRFSFNDNVSSYSVACLTSPPRMTCNPLNNMPWSITPVLHPISVWGTEYSTLANYDLLPPLLVLNPHGRIEAKLGSEGQLTLSGWLLNRLDP